MTRTTALLSPVLLLLLALCGQRAEATGKWLSRKDHHYYFASVHVKWSDAQRQCRSLGAELVSIGNKGENSFLFRRNPQDSDPKLTMTSHWIGLMGYCDYYSAGYGADACSWEWSSREPVDTSVFQWALGYPTATPESPMTFAYLDLTSECWKNGVGEEYRGFICKVLDGCLPRDPCTPPASCVSDSRGGYSCDVSTNTSDVIDVCASAPCVHGECRAQGGGYECQCRAGYTGTHCDTDIDECRVNVDLTFADTAPKRRPGADRGSGSSSLCVNGVCRNTEGGFLCDCAPGYHGALCAADVNECHHHDACLYGNCTNTVGGFVCTCWEGYSGRYCEIEEGEEEVGGLGKATGGGVISQNNTPVQGVSDLGSPACRVESKVWQHVLGVWFALIVHVFLQGLS